MICSKTSSNLISASFVPLNCQTGPHSLPCRWTLRKYTTGLWAWWLVASLSKGSCCSPLTAYSSPFFSASCLCNLILLGIPFCYFLYLTSKIFVCCFKISIVVPRIPDKYATLQNVSGCLLGVFKPQTIYPTKCIEHLLCAQLYSRSHRYHEQIRQNCCLMNLHYSWGERTDI